MKRFRTFLLWCHLLTGLTVGVVVFVMSATGVLLTYQRQMTAWADRRGLAPVAASPAGRPLPVETLVERARAHVGKGAPTAVAWRSGPDAPVQVAFGRERSVFLDPVTGAVLGEGSARARRFFRLVTEWHRYLAASGERRAIGRGITGAANLGFLFLVVSGVYLWWPRSWSPRALRSVTLFQRGLAGKARDFNWHNTIGLWSLVPLFVVVLSGVVISYRWAGSLVYRVVGEAPPGPQPQPAPPAPGRGAVALGGLDTLVAVAAQRVPEWRTLTLTLPTAPAAPVAFSIDRGTGGEPHKIAQLSLDRTTGEAVKWQPFSAGTRGRRLRSILRFAHTGEVLGLVGQTIAGLVSLGATLLVWTGFALSWRRWVAWRARRARFAEPSARAAAKVA